MTEILPHLRTSGKTEKLKLDLNCGIPRSTAIMEISEDKDEIFGHKAPGTSQNLSEKRKSVCREHNYPGEGGSGNISPLAKFSSLSEKRRVKRVRSEGSDFSSSSSCDSSPVAAALKIENYEGDKFQIEASSWMKINARIRKEEHAKFRELCRKAKETLFPERASQLESKAVENKSVIRKLSTVQEPGILSSLLSKGSEVTYLCRWKLEKETVCKYVDRDDLLKCCPKAIEKFSVGMHESEGVIPTSRKVKVEPAGTAEFNSPYEDNEENVEVPIRKRREGPGSQGDPKRRRAEERALSPPTPLMSQALTPPPPWQFNAFPKMNPQHLMALMQYRAFLARTQQGLRASMMYQRMMMPNHLMNSYAAPAAQTFMSHMSKAMGHPGQASPSYAYHDRNLARDGRRQEEPSEHLQDQRRHRPSPRQQQMPDRIRSPNRKPRGSHGKKSDKIVSQGSRKLGRDDHYEARSDKSYRNDGSRISPELPSQYRRCSSARPSEDQRRNTRERSQ